MSHARFNGRNVSWQWLRKHPEALRAYLAGRTNFVAQPSSGRRYDKKNVRTAADDRREQIDVIVELALKLDGVKLSRAAAEKMLLDSEI